MPSEPKQLRFEYTYVFTQPITDRKPWHDPPYARQFRMLQNALFLAEIPFTTEAYHYLYDRTHVLIVKEVHHDVQSLGR